MTLYITNHDVQGLSGIKFTTAAMGTKAAHLVIASFKFQKCYLEIAEDIPEGMLKSLPSEIDEFVIDVPEHPSLHQLHLLCEVLPEQEGKLRKAYMKGESIHALLPEVWEYRDAG